MSRSSTYYKTSAPKDDPVTERAIETLYEEDATLGRRRMPIMLKRRYGIEIGAKKCQRLKKKPCVVMDWDSRFVRGWSMGRNMDVSLCLEALEMAQKSGCRPQIFNTDQGSQYTSKEWKEAMLAKGIKISMDGKGRWADNIIMERFWRTYKYDFFLPREPKNLDEAIEMTSEWVEYHNRERPPSSLKNCSPLMYRENHATPPSGEFLARFFRSGTTRVATLGTPCLCFKISPKMA